MSTERYKYPGVSLKVDFAKSNFKIPIKGKEIIWSCSNIKCKRHNNKFSINWNYCPGCGTKASNIDAEIPVECIWNLAGILCPNISHGDTFRLHDEDVPFKIKSSEVIFVFNPELKGAKIYTSEMIMKEFGDDVLSLKNALGENNVSFFTKPFEFYR